MEAGMFKRRESMDDRKDKDGSVELGDRGGCPAAKAIAGKLRRYEKGRERGEKRVGDYHCPVGEWLEIHGEDEGR